MTEETKNATYETMTALVNTNNDTLPIPQDIENKSDLSVVSTPMIDVSHNILDAEQLPILPLIEKSAYTKIIEDHLQFYVSMLRGFEQHLPQNETRISYSTPQDEYVNVMNTLCNNVIPYNSSNAKPLSSLEFKRAFNNLIVDLTNYNDSNEMNKMYILHVKLALIDSIIRLLHGIIFNNPNSDRLELLSIL